MAGIWAGINIYRNILWLIFRKYLQYLRHKYLFDIFVIFLCKYKHAEGESSIPHIMLPYAPHTLSQGSEIEFSIKFLQLWGWALSLIITWNKNQCTTLSKSVLFLSVWFFFPQLLVRFFASVYNSQKIFWVENICWRKMTCPQSLWLTTNVLRVFSVLKVTSQSR